MTSLGIPFNQKTSSNRILGNKNNNISVIDNINEVKWRYDRAENNEFYKKNMIGKAEILNMSDGTLSKESIKHSSDFKTMDAPNNHGINLFLQKKRDHSKDSNEKSNSPSYRSKPSALNLFPYIGMVNNNSVFKTFNQNDQEQNIQRDPSGQIADTRNMTHASKPHELKDYLNAKQKTNNMLI